MTEMRPEIKVGWMKQDSEGHVEEFRAYSQRAECFGIFPLMLSEDICFVTDFHPRVPGSFIAFKKL